MGDETPYVSLMIIMWLNKITISYFGAKIRQHLINPGFIKNQKKFKEEANREKPENKEQIEITLNTE